MKLSRVTLRQVVPGSGGPFATSCWRVENGFELTFEGGLITATHKDGGIEIVPVGNVIAMKPLEVKAAKK